MEKRRVRSNLIETFKIISGLHDVNREIFFELDDDARRGHSKRSFIHVDLD